MSEYVLTFSDPMKNGKLVELPFLTYEDVQEYIETNIRPYNANKPFNEQISTRTIFPPEEYEILDEMGLPRPKFDAETFNAPYAGAGALMPIKGDTALSSFSGKELAESSAIHGDFNQASINYSGHQNLEVRGAEGDQHECITCAEPMGSNPKWSCECCGFLVGTEGSHEGCGANIDGTVVCNYCYQEGHKVQTMITIGGGEVIFNSTCKGWDNEKHFGDREYEIIDEYVLGAESFGAELVYEDDGWHEDMTDAELKQMFDEQMDAMEQYQLVPCRTCGSMEIGPEHPSEGSLISCDHCGAEYNISGELTMDVRLDDGAPYTFSPDFLNWLGYWKSIEQKGFEGNNNANRQNREYVMSKFPKYLNEMHKSLYAESFGAEDMDGRVVNIVGVEDKVYVTIRFPDTKEHYGYDKIFVGDIEELKEACVMLPEVIGWKRSSFGADAEEYTVVMSGFLTDDGSGEKEFTGTEQELKDMLYDFMMEDRFDKLLWETDGDEEEAERIDLERWNKKSLEQICDDNEYLTLRKSFGADWDVSVDKVTHQKQTFHVKDKDYESQAKRKALSLAKKKKGGWKNYPEGAGFATPEYEAWFARRARAESFGAEDSQKMEVTFKIQDADYATFYYTTEIPYGLRRHSDEDIISYVWGDECDPQDDDWFYCPYDWNGVGEHYLAKVMNKTLKAESFGAEEGKFYQLEIKYNMADGWEWVADFTNEQDAIDAYYDHYDKHPEVQIVEVDSDGDGEWLLKTRNYALGAESYGKRQRFGNRYVARDTKGKFISNVSVGRSLKADRRNKSKTPARSGFGHKGDARKGASSDFKLPTDAKSLIGIGAVLGGLLAYLESKA